MTGRGGIYLLAGLLGFWLVMRSINRDASGRTLVDHLLGQSGGANQIPLPTGSSATGGSGSQPGSGNPLSGAAANAPGGLVAGVGSVLKSIFPQGTSIAIKRRDQGRDLQVTPGAQVLAPGNGTVLANGYNPGGFGVSYPIIHFTSGPWAGQDVYFGHVQSLVKPGEPVIAGLPIAQTQHGAGPYVGNASGLPGWTEIGLAPGGSPGSFGQPLPAGL